MWFRLFLIQLNRANPIDFFHDATKFIASTTGSPSFVPTVTYRRFRISRASFDTNSAPSCWTPRESSSISSIFSAVTRLSQTIWPSLNLKEGGSIGWLTAVHLFQISCPTRRELLWTIAVWGQFITDFRGRRYSQIALPSSGLRVEKIGSRRACKSTLGRKP